MKRARSRPKLSVSGPKDAIRIVPLHLPLGLTLHREGLLAVPAPRLTYRNGPLLAAVEVFTVFWGNAWKQSPQTQMATDLNNFFTTILQSSLLTEQMAEYGVPKYQIGAGTFVGTAVVTTPVLGKSVTDAGIQQMLQDKIAKDKTFPKPGANTLYFVYLPPGVKVTLGGSASCQAFCGYHDAIGSHIFYAVMPYPNCQGCLGGLSDLASLTSTSSHELCEAITDAVPGQGWYDDGHGEVGDICAWETKQIENYTVQLEWSNRAGKCI
jgi:hypothetical protein